MTMGKSHKKRKKINLSIKREMQVRLILRIFIIILIAVLFSGTIFWLGSHKNVASTYRQFHVQLRNFKDLILPMAVIGTVAGLLGALVVSLFFPLRLAGPLYRIENILQKALHGDLSDQAVKVRSGDELQELAWQVSKMIEKMRENVIVLKENNNQMEKIHNTVAEALRSSNLEMVKEAMTDLEEEMAKVRGVLDGFKV